MAILLPLPLEYPVTGMQCHAQLYYVGFFVLIVWVFGISFCFVLSWFGFETGSHYVALADLKLTRPL